LVLVLDAAGVQSPRPLAKPTRHVDQRGCQPSSRSAFAFDPQGVGLGRRPGHADHVVASGGELGYELGAERNPWLRRRTLSCGTSFVIQVRAVTCGGAIPVLLGA
jgi:hypothetical protein